jgi:hypothetical protein
MFLMIHESGDMVRIESLTDGDLSAADDGVVELLDVSEAGNPKRYNEGEWHEIKVSNT